MLRGGYELGFGAFRCVYEKAREVEEGLSDVMGLGTGFGAVVEARFQLGKVKVDWAGSSLSDALSQASSSTVSEGLKKVDGRRTI